MLVGINHKLRDIFDRFLEEVELKLFSFDDVLRIMKIDKDCFSAPYDLIECTKAEWIGINTTLKKTINGTHYIQGIMAFIFTLMIIPYRYMNNILNYFSREEIMAINCEYFCYTGGYSLEGMTYYGISKSFMIDPRNICIVREQNLQFLMFRIFCRFYSIPSFV